MRDTLGISGVRFTPATWKQRERGLLGWVSLVVGGELRIDGIVLRRTRDGSIRLFFPERHDSAGMPHAIVWPMRSRTRARIERQVLATLERRGRLAS